ncbi:MAG: DUF885 family protein [Pyrinomonadaceae bacterium]|nr:DUF885 family protein [Pyrinomonadaceae bacterium]MBP9109551.1 DUF885 family protein [Pyrinomonadaceae bacterium]
MCELIRRSLCLLIIVIVAAPFTFGQPDVLTSHNEPPSRMRGVIEKFSEDRGILNRFYSAPTSPNRAARFKQLYRDQIQSIERLNYDSLNHDEQIDYVLFMNHLNHEIRELEREEVQMAEMASLMPFARTISDLEDTRRKLEFADPAKSAAMLNELAKQVSATQRSLEAPNAVKPKRTVANRAARTVDSLRRTLRSWYTFYNAYDPTFTWWCESPYKSVDDALGKYTTFITEKLVGIRADDRTTIIGDPIGREALIEELKFEMIPYTPEELVEIANKEFEWCVTEFKKASREMGFGDDYMKAIEAVKQKYVEPGKQPELIKKQAYEAIEYMEKNDLVTVPKIARDGWRMEMMTPERQLIAPFFLGGETILVSYPTDGMTHEQKMMSMRGNNPHFARAVTHHELIPGHHLQGFMTRRYRPYRELFRTPFWGEGWALYWEFILWDRGFTKTPEDKIGALFWRSHRAARIIFSLNFHLEKWTPQECVDLLVNKVGHERDNALAEVRRSFSGDYGPLYQMAYMMGGIQFYQLHKDLVGSKKMTDRQFHDAILKEGAIPVEMVRAILTKQKLAKDHKSSWRYYPGLAN